MTTRPSEATFRAPPAAPASTTGSPEVTTPSPARRWTGRALTTLAVLFLLMDAGGKILRADLAVEGTTQLGYPESSVTRIGWTLLACTVAHLIPRTAALGAILLTGFLGGAVATHLRLENPLFSHTLFPVYFGAMIWIGLLLRDDALRRALLPMGDSPGEEY